MTDTQTAWRYVGTRYPIQSPQGAQIQMHVIAVDHPNGPWEAVYCNTQEIAETIRDRVNAYDAMLKAIRHHAPCPCDRIPTWHNLETACPKADLKAALAAAEGKGR